MKPWQRILLGLVLGVVAGLLINRFCVVSREPIELSPLGNKLVGIIGGLGSLFIQALKMIIVPLIFTAIVTGIAGLGKTEGFARMGIKTVGYYVMTSFLAILIGLTMVNLVKPGLENGEPNPRIVAAIEASSADYSSAAEGKVAGRAVQGVGEVSGILMRAVPENIFAVFGDNGKMLALIFVSLLTGMGLIYVSEQARSSVLPLFDGLNELTLKITDWIMWTAPIGVFGLITKSIAITGFEVFPLLAKYVFVVIGALAIHLLVVMPLILFFFARVNPWRHFYVMRNALLTAFSTSSSAATLPVTMNAVHKDAGVSERVTSFVLPLGATVNMDGTALYECIAVLFISQVLGIELSIAEQFLVVALALLTSIGVAGVPSASLVAIVIILNNVPTVPNEATPAVIGFLLAVDRLLDMSRTAVNIFSDSCGAIVIAKSEGEDNVLAA